MPLTLEEYARTRIKELVGIEIYIDIGYKPK